MAFKIPSIPPTANQTIRFPNDLIEKDGGADPRQGLHLFRFCDRSGTGCGG